MGDVVNTILIAAATGIVTGLIGIYFLGTLKREYEAKYQETREELKRQRAFARKRAIIDSRRKSAEAAYLTRLADKFIPGGENDGLARARERYNAVDAEDKALDAEILAEYEVDF